MNEYGKTVLKYKPEFSYLDTREPLKATYSDGSKSPYNPQVFPYARDFLSTLLQRVYNTYAAITKPEDCEKLCKELASQLKQDFRFDFSDHLGPMRQRDKRGADSDVKENDYNMFHSCYKFVNQAARAKSFGEKFNLSLMSGRVNADNQTGAEICDPFVFGPALYLYSKAYSKVVAMTLPGFDTPEKVMSLQLHEKEMKKDMLAQKAQAAKALKMRWHFLINQKFMPENMSFKDLSIDTVKDLSKLHTKLLTELSSRIEGQYQADVHMLKKVMKLLHKQMTYHHEKGTPASELSSVQLASLHAMQANELLKDSSVIQVSIEAEKPIYSLLAEILQDDDSLTSKIFDNPQTRAVFEMEMKKIHTVKDSDSYGNLLDCMISIDSNKMPAYAKTSGGEYSHSMSREQMVEALKKGEAMPKVSFMLAVLLMETGAKIEGGSSQIVYAKRIKEAVNKVFDVAVSQPEFDNADINNRRQIIDSFNYRTAQAQIWGVKEDGEVLGYRNLIDGSVKIDDNLLSAIAELPSQDAFEAAAVHRFYEFVSKQNISNEDMSKAKTDLSKRLLTFKDNSDYAGLLSDGSEMYQELAAIINNDENVKKHHFAEAVKFKQQEGR